MSELMIESEEDSDANPDTEITKAKKYDTVVKSGQATLKALLILDGGATIAFLVFMQNILQKPVVNIRTGSFFIEAMQWFIWGTFSAVLSFGAIFLTNCLSLVGWNRASNAFFAVTLLIGLCSFGFFLYASAVAVKGFQLVGAAFFVPG